MNISYDTEVVAKAYYMAPFLLVTKSSPPPSGGSEKRDDYDEETAYESYMNPELGFQSGPGDSSDAD